MDYIWRIIDLFCGLSWVIESTILIRKHTIFIRMNIYHDYKHQVFFFYTSSLKMRTTIRTINFSQNTQYLTRLRTPNPLIYFYIFLVFTDPKSGYVHICFFILQYRVGVWCGRRKICGGWREAERGSWPASEMDGEFGE